MRFWSFKPTASAPADEVDLTVYGVVGDTPWDDTSAVQFRKDLDEHKSAKRINVRINSGGGDAFSGIAIHSMLQAHPAEVLVTVEGLAASAASIIAMSGRVRMANGAMLMIHNPAAIAMGEASDLRQTADVLDKVRDSLVAIYQAKTGKTVDELQTLLDAETWLTADEAVAEGFADEVAGEVVPQAKGELVIFNSIAFPASMAPPLPAPPAPDAVPEPEPQAVLTREALTAGAPELLDELIEEGRQAERTAQAAATRVVLTREILAVEAPEVLAALLAEGAAQARAEATAAERARIQAIEAMAIRGHRELTASAKYGAEGVEPMTPEAYAMAVLQAERQQQAKHLSDAAADAADSFVPSSSPPERGSAEAAYRAHLIKVGAEASSVGRSRK